MGDLFVALRITFGLEIMIESGVIFGIYGIFGNYWKFKS